MRCRLDRLARQDRHVTLGGLRGVGRKPAAYAQQRADRGGRVTTADHAERALAGRADERHRLSGGAKNDL